MKSVVILVAALIFTDKLSGAHNDIRCYSCSTKDSTTCLHPEKNRLELKTCKPESLKEMKEHVGNVNPDMQSLFEVHFPREFNFNCMKQVTKVADKEYVTRGCQLANADENLDICKELFKGKFAGSNVSHCSLCSRDGCNNSNNFRAFNLYSLIASFGIFFVWFGL